MTDLKRYEEVKDALSEKIEYKEEKLYFNNKKLNLINNKVPNFITEDLDKLTDKM